MPDASASSTPPATDSTLGQALNDNNAPLRQSMSDLLRQTQSASAAGRAAAEAFPAEVERIKQERDIKEQSLSEQLQTLTNAEMESLKSQPPKPEPTSIAEQWGSPAMLLAVLGSAFTKQPLTNALNAGAAVMRGYQSRDYDAAQQAYKQWEHSTDTAIKLSSIQAGMIEKAMENIRNASKDDINEKKAEAQLLLGPGALNIPALRAMADAGQYEKLGLLVKQMNLSLANLKDKTAEAKRQNTLMQDSREADKELQAAQAAGDPQKIADATKKAQEAHQALIAEGSRLHELKTGAPPQQTTVPSEQKYPDKWPGMPDKPPPGYDPTAWTGALYLAQTGQMPSMGFGNTPLRTAIIAAWPAAQHALGIKPSEQGNVVAEFQGQKSGERALGTRTANLGLAAEELRQFVPLAKAASASVPRTQYPSVNSIYEAALQGIGGENVVRLAVALQTVTGAYAQVRVRQGASTDAARAEANAIVNKAWSDGQINAAMDQMMFEVEGALKAPAAVQGAFRRQAPGTPPDAAITGAAGHPDESHLPIIQDGNMFDPVTHKYLGPAPQ